jgi:hypothetical protein
MSESEQGHEPCIATWLNPSGGAIVTFSDWYGAADEVEIYFDPEISLWLASGALTVEFDPFESFKAALFITLSYITSMFNIDLSPQDIQDDFLNG